MVKFGVIIAIVEFLAALYLLNVAFGIVSLAFLVSIEKWIFVVAGALLILAAYNSYSKSSESY